MIPENTTQSAIARIDKKYRLILKFEQRIRAMDTQTSIAANKNSSVKYRDYTPKNTKWETERRNLINELGNYICNRGVIIKSMTEPDDVEYMRLYELYKTLPETIKKHCDRIGIEFCRLNSNNKTPYEKIVLRTIAENTLLARKSEIVYRIKQMILEANAKGQYVIFNTLTVAPENYAKVFKKGSREWSKYVQMLKRKTGLECYIAVTERGAKTGRLHIHVIQCLTRLPDGTRDPNAGRQNATHREVDSMKKYWIHGNSMPIALRMSYNDAYSALKWRQPVVRDTTGHYTVVKSNDPIVISRYMAKYLTKNADKRGLIKSWRTKMTQKAGLTAIIKITSKLTIRELRIAVISHSKKMITINKMIMPRTHWRHYALKSLLAKLKRASKMKRIVWRAFWDVKRAGAFLARFAWTQTDPTPSGLDCLNTSFSPTRNLKNMGICKDIQKAVRQEGSNYEMQFKMTAGILT